MKANVSNIDKTVRLLLVFVIAVLYMSGMLPGKAALVMGIIAAILVVTSVISFCPLYAVLRVNTRKNSPSA